MKKQTIISRLVLVLGILILLNFIANRLLLRLDFTADKRYTLSNATKDILSKLPSPVTVKAYFSDNLPPNIAQTKKDFQDELTEFSNYSSGKLVYEFINPAQDEPTEMKVQQSGITPILIDIREKDQIKQQKAYLGALIQMGEKSEVIPVIQPGAAMEYALSTAIKKISVDEKPKIALIQGQGEPTKAALPQAMQSLSILYDVEEFDLNDTLPIPQTYKTAVIVAPKDTFNLNQLKQLDDYVASGGNLYIAFDAVNGDLQNAYANDKETGLEEWLKSKGVIIENNFVRDVNCGTVTVQQRQAFFTFNSQVKFPYFPIISNFTKHPITSGLEAIILPFVSSISYSKIDTSVTLIPLALTSPKSGVEKPPFMFDISKKWAEDDFTLGSLPVAIAMDGKISGNKKTKMVIVTNGSFAVNGEGQGAQQLNPDNVYLMVNAIDWLSDDTGLIELRTKGITSRPLDQIEENTKTMLKYGNVFLPILLIIAYGFIRFQINQRKRLKWMADEY